MTDEELDRISRAEKIQLYTENRCEALEKENDLAKSLLYCTKGTCDNCGFVNCENFQMQRKGEPCALYISYKDRIKNLEQENADLKTRVENQKSFLERIQAKFNLGKIDRKEIEGYLESDKLNKAKEIITALLCIPNDMAYEELNSGSWDIVYKAEQFLKEE